MKKLTHDFSKLVLNKVINSKPISGALEFIKNDTSYNKFIITGTPNEEIIRITKKLNIHKYFKDIKGSPQKKEYWSEYFISKYNLNRNETIFVGDAVADFKAAKFSRLHFALRSSELNINFFKKKDVFKFKSFGQLINHINEI